MTASSRSLLATSVASMLAAGLVDEVRMDVVLTPTNPRKPSTEGEALPVFLEDDLWRHWTRRGGASSPGD